MGNENEKWLLAEIPCWHSSHFRGMLTSYLDEQAGKDDGDLFEAHFRGKHLQIAL